MPVPRVSVRNSVRKPIRPRAGTRNSIRTQPVPWLAICSIRPLRAASSWVTAPRYSSGTSMVSRSTGSCTLPSISRVTTCGLPTVSSKPSRRICSTRMASASSPRPCTSQVSGRSVGQHPERDVADQLRSSRSLTRRAVTLVPLTRPASGEVLVPMVIEMAGSSTVISGSGARVLRVGQGLADHDLRDAGDGDDVAGAGRLGRACGRAPRSSAAR